MGFSEINAKTGSAIWLGYDDNQAGPRRHEAPQKQQVTPEPVGSGSGSGVLGPTLGIFTLDLGGEGIQGEGIKVHATVSIDPWGKSDGPCDVQVAGPYS